MKWVIEKIAKVNLCVETRANHFHFVTAEVMKNNKFAEVLKCTYYEGKTK